MAVFILIPIIAPLLGAAIVSMASWRWVFGTCIAAGAAMALWAIRLPETLHDEHRLELRFGRVLTAARFVVSDRQAVGSTLAMTFLYGSFMGYLASSEIIIGQGFGRPALFPFTFAGFAGLMGLSMLTNARVVVRVGSARMVRVLLGAYVAASALLVSVAIAANGQPPFWMFIVGTAPLLMMHAMLIPNLNALAMTHMAPVAGTASSIIGATQIAGGAALGALIDQSYNGTVAPLWVGFAVYGILAAAAATWARRAPARTAQDLAAR